MRLKLIFVAALAPLILFSAACKKPFTEKDILDQLDAPFIDLNRQRTYNDFVSHNYDSRSVTYTFQLDLEHGYCLTAGSRIHLYADSTRWAIVFEKSGYENRGSDAEIELDYFGNCFTQTVKHYDGYTYYSNSNSVVLISGDDYEKIRNRTGKDMDTFERLSPDANEVVVQGRRIKIEHDTTKYAKAGINLNSADNPKHLIGYGDLVRYLNETEPFLLQPMESEIRKYISADLPKLMTIDKFHFASIYDKKNLPSKQEMYQLIAKVLVLRDSSLWKPTLKANNHWANWDSGNL
jgi:hypothetical protein